MRLAYGKLRVHSLGTGGRNGVSLNNQAELQPAAVQMQKRLWSLAAASHQIAHVIVRSFSAAM